MIEWIYYETSDDITLTLVFKYGKKNLGYNTPQANFFFSVSITLWQVPSLIDYMFVCCLKKILTRIRSLIFLSTFFTYYRSVITPMFNKWFGVICDASLSRLRKFLDVSLLNVCGTVISYIVKYLECCVSQDPLYEILTQSSRNNIQTMPNCD